jgi:hypothetical protein
VVALLENALQLPLSFANFVFVHFLPVDSQPENLPGLFSYLKIKNGEP